MAAKYGILNQDGYTERVIFVIDKKGIIRHVEQHDPDDLPDNATLFTLLADMK